MAFFQVTDLDKEARCGVMTTSHGVVETPVFMPVGTRASVKTVSQEDLGRLGAKIILGNTYHLYLRPGHELIERVAGDLHRFMSYEGAILTDSGGYQVFSLSKLNKITEKGVYFKSHIDGSSHFIGPKESMAIQRGLGSDIVMVFDECPALPSKPEKMVESVERTIRWAKICRDYDLKPHQHLFGIVQGGLDFDLRKNCLDELIGMDFPGYALGGLSVGEKNEEMVQFLKNFVPIMPKDKPRYLMGVGTPIDLLNGVKAGIDMFDCVLPCRNARNGQALTSRGPISIKQERYKEDTSPLDPDCECPTCKRYSKAYLRHLYTIGEYLAGQLLTYHNLHFYLKMMREVRMAIKQRNFGEYHQEFLRKWNGLDNDQNSL